ncbi:hypothetical protein C6H68_03840 [Photorhabdus luminescens]|nr:hypothetical protein C6H68_03840 [Photorhabdus luminescens]
MDIAATGGFLYAQAMEEVYRREETEKSCKGLGPIKSCKVFGSKTEHRIQIKKTNKVTEFTAGGDINLMAKDEVTLEASRIETGKNAKITSQTGKVNFKAMPNIDFEQTITTSKGFFITQRDKGHREESWIIPSVHVGGTLTVEAATGINADVKVKEGQLLEDALGVLGNTPGTEWLKNIQNRNDVQWNQVKDAYSSWDKKKRKLKPRGGCGDCDCCRGGHGGFGFGGLGGKWRRGGDRRHGSYGERGLWGGLWRNDRVDLAGGGGLS